MCVCVCVCVFVFVCMSVSLFQYVRRLLDKKVAYEKHKSLLEQEGSEEDLQELEETLTPDEKEQIKKIEKVLSKYVIQPL